MDNPNRHLLESNQDSDKPHQEDFMDSANRHSMHGVPLGQHELPPFPYPPQTPFVRKSKFLTALLSFFIPGTGHFYLGLMQKGLFMMMLMTLDIVAIVFFSPAGPMGEAGFNIPLITLLSIGIPILYFYNIFDALQSADKVNAGILNPAFPGTESPWPHRHGSPENGSPRGGNLSWGWVFIAAGLFFFFVSSKPSWLKMLFEAAGSYVGAIIFIGAGGFLLWKESRNKS